MIKRILTIVTGLSLMLGVALAETHASGPSSGVSTWTGGSGSGSTAYTYSDSLQCGNATFTLAGPPAGIGGTVPIRTCNVVLVPCQCLSAFGPVLRRNPNPPPRRRQVGAWYFCFSC